MSKFLSLRKSKTLFNFKYPFESIRVIYPGYRGPPIMTQNSRYDLFPLAANGLGTIHAIPRNGPATPG
jgi:hypothetical protein